MSIKEKSSNFKRSIQDSCKNENGLTIVEVMVAFVLVLLAIAMITTVTMLATRVQKQTKDSQQRMTQLAEAAYRQLQPVYDETEQCWKTGVSEAVLTNESAPTQLKFTGNGMEFDVNVRTADWVVSAEAEPSETEPAESGTVIHTTYHIYR